MATYAEFSSAFNQPEFNTGTILTSTIGGTLAPAGDVLTLMTYLQALAGELDLSGALVASNPAWLLIDDILTWMGEWSSTYSYDIDDVVLYKSTDGNEWHVFVSKIGHNVGNTPTSSATAWRRLYQEQWL